MSLSYSIRTVNQVKYLCQIFETFSLWNKKYFFISLLDEIILKNPTTTSSLKLKLHEMLQIRIDTIIKIDLQFSLQE